MVILVTVTIGLVWWVTAWALGIKSLDAFILTVIMTALAAGWYVARPHLDAFLGREGPA
jgi:hypothetical protein